MMKTAWLMLLVILVGMVIALSSQQATAAEYPNVSGLQAFTAESNYMSHAGYLRWMVFREQQVWLSMAEAQRIVAEQTGTM